jgi:hypothetical protein
MTDLMTRALGTPNRLAQTARDLAIPILFRLPAFRHTMVKRLSQLGVSYSGSPIVSGNGERYFDDSLRGGSGICSKFVLMIGDGADQSISDAATDLTNEMDEVVEVRASRTEGVRLVRPDGYVAFQANGSTAAIGDVRSSLRKMTVARHEH